MKEPSRLSRPKKPPSEQKVKLLCSFNGAFFSPPFPGKLRYVGGETRLVSVDRSIGISRLLSKIAEFCPNYPSFTLKYQLPDTDNGDYGHIDDPTLVSIETDEDVRCMIEEYDRVADYRKNVRLRVFVCNGNGYEGWKTDSSFSGFYSDFKNSGAGRCSATDSTFWDTTTVKHVAGVRRSGDICLNNDAEPKSICGVRTQNLGGLLSSVLSEPPKLTSQMVTIQNSGNPAVLEASKDKFGDGHVADVRPQISMPLVSNKSLYSCNANQSESLSTRFREGLALEDGVSSENYDLSLGMVAFPHQPHGFKPGSRKLLHVNLNGENIMPPITGHNRVKSPLPPVSSNKQYGGKAFPLASLARNYGISNNNQCVIRNLDMSSIKNRSGLLDIGNRLDLGLGRKPSYGGCYAGLRPRLNISKAGQGRSNYAHLGKTMYGPRENSVVGMGNTLISPKWTRSLFECGNSRGILREWTMLPSDGRVSVDHFRGQVCLRDEFGNPNLHKNRLDCSRVQHDLLEPEKTYHHMSNHPFLCGDVMTNPIPCPEVKTSGRDHLWTSNATKCEIQSPFMFNNPINNALHYSAPCTERSQCPLVSVDSCSGKLQAVQLCETPKAAVKDSSNGQNPHDKTSADLSVHQPLFSPSDKVASPTFCTSLPISEGLGTDRDLLMHDQTVESRTSISALDDTSPRCRTAPQCNQMDIMDDCSPSMEPLRENLNGVGGITLNTPIKCVTKLGSLLKLSGPSSTTVAPVSFSSGKAVGCEEEKKQNTSSSFNVVEKANRKESGCNSEVVNGTASNLAAFYTLLPTRQLQTIKHSDLEEIRELGSGSFGTVFYGKWKGSDVAIKRLKPTCFSGEDVGEERLIADFWKEAHLLGQLHHPNVVALYGVVTDGPATNLATVTEYMVNGSLKQVLRRKDRIIDRRKRLIIAMDVAFGMEYLHEKNIVHFDLKSHNLLVNMRDPLRPVCKIGDLGLSKVKKRTLVSGGVRGTLPWMAPELLKSGSSMVTEKVDVYSFGVVMWELLTGEEPYANMRSEEIIAGIIKGDLRPEIPHWCDPAWRSLMERCWSSDPVSRPSFSEVAKELRAISASMNI